MEEGNEDEEHQQTPTILYSPASNALVGSALQTRAELPAPRSQRGEEVAL